MTQFEGVPGKSASSGDAKEKLETMERKIRTQWAHQTPLDGVSKFIDLFNKRFLTDSLYGTRGEAERDSKDNEEHAAS